MDKLIIVMFVLAALTALTGMFYQNSAFTGFVEGASIGIIMVILITIGSVTDYVKDKQFLDLLSEVKDEEVPVVRGKYGATQSVNAYSLVVGDIILLEAGSRVPADCVLIEGQDIEVDENYYWDGPDPVIVKKDVCTEENMHAHVDPFLMSYTLITGGYGKAVVCCVGVDSRRGLRIDDGLGLSNEKTPLQTRLDILASHFSKYGLYAAILIFITSIVYYFLKIAFSDSTVFFDSETPYKFVQFATLAVTIVLVAVPEGLPLAVGLSLAFSVKQMKKDKILVKNMSSPETMGTVNEILCGKTSTLTKGDMNVVEFYISKRSIKNTKKNTFLNSGIDGNLLRVAQDCILFNSTARIEMNDDAMYGPVGNSTECGMLKFLQLNDIPVHDDIKRKHHRVLAHIPFSC